MTQPALKLDSKNLDECMSLGVDIEEGLKNKPAFAAVSPTPAEMEARRAAIGVQRGKIAAAEAKVDLENGALSGLEAEYRGALGRQATSAILAVNGDVAQLEGTNIPLRQPGTPATDAPPPLENVGGTYGDLSGEIDWSWNGGAGRPVYTAETSASADGPFVHAYSGTRSRFTSKGHAPGSLVFMRARCNCNGFDSNWSQVVAHRAR